MLNKKLPLLLLASPFLFASKCKERRNQAITEDVVNVARPESTIQVTGIVPSSVPAGTTPRARITGTGFEKSANVFIGGQQVFGVQFMSPNELRINLPALTPGMYDISQEQRWLKPHGLWLTRSEYGRAGTSHQCPKSMSRRHRH